MHFRRQTYSKEPNKQIYAHKSSLALLCRFTVICARRRQLDTQRRPLGPCVLDPACRARPPPSSPWPKQVLAKLPHLHQGNDQPGKYVEDIYWMPSTCFEKRMNDNIIRMAYSSAAYCLNRIIRMHFKELFHVTQSCQFFNDVSRTHYYSYFHLFFQHM